MNLSQKLALALATLTAINTGFSQTDSSGASTGLLGQRYADVNFGLSEIRGVPDNAYGANLSVNMPFNANLDLGLGYGYNWMTTQGVRLDQRTIGAMATAYMPWQGIKPFASAELGYQWQKAKVGGANFSRHKEAGIWAFAIGAEVPVSSSFTLTPSISYTQGFESGTGSGYFNYGIEASKWFGKLFGQTVGGYAAVSVSDDNSFYGETWTYTIGLRLKF